MLVVLNCLTLSTFGKDSPGEAHMYDVSCVNPCRMGCSLSTFSSRLGYATHIGFVLQRAPKAGPKRLESKLFCRTVMIACQHLVMVTARYPPY